MNQRMAGPAGEVAIDITAAIIERVGAVARRPVSAAVRQVAKQCMLDWFGVALAGEHEPLVRLLVEQVAEEGSHAVATVLGQRTMYSARQAALVNGAMGHAIDYDDVNIDAQGHVTAALFAAALAAAEVERASGDTLLRAFVAGYETAAMLGRLLGRGHYDRGFHSTATIGAVAAASCSAVLLRLDADATARAFGIAATQAAGLKAQFGTMCKPLHAGKANETGLVSAQLARRGFGSRRDVLQCSQGFADAMSPSFDPEAALAPPRDEAFLLDNLFKFSAACYGTHGAIEAARQLRLVRGLEPAQIRRVELRVEPGADRMCNIAAPVTGLQAKFSLRFNAALVLAGEDTASPGAYTDALVARADLCGLRDRIEVRPMPEDWPLTLTEVDIETTDGRLLKAVHDTGLPASDLAAQGARLRVKFDALAGPVIGAGRATELACAIEAIDQMSNIGELMALVR